MGAYAVRQYDNTDYQKQSIGFQNHKTEFENPGTGFQGHSIDSQDLNLDWNEVFDRPQIQKGSRQVGPVTVSDGLIMSLSNLGRVDIPYIAEVSGESPRMVIARLKGSIFQNPDTWQENDFLGWETAEEYLSGNLVKKWRSAYAANEKYHGLFAENVDAIRQVIPPVVGAKDIYVILAF